MSGTELKKMTVNARNAEQLFRKATGVMEGEIARSFRKLRVVRLSVGTVK